MHSTFGPAICPRYWSKLAMIASSRTEEVEMIDFDVQQDRAEQRQLQVGAVTLVGLDHQPFAIGPLCSGPHVGHVATDDERRAQTGCRENQHQHRTRRGLPVGARNTERTWPGRRSTTASRRGSARRYLPWQPRRARCSWPELQSTPSQHCILRRVGDRGRRARRRPQRGRAPEPVDRAGHYR